jgi:thiol-disulfide isomerase/thioredoxin
MKRASVIFLLFVFVQSNSQHISGKLENFTDTYFNIEYTPDWLSRKLDTVHVNEKGEFDFNFQVQHPAIVKLLLTSRISQELFIAPGLSLDIKANVGDKEIYTKTLQFSGLAAKYSNFFRVVQSSQRYKTFDYSDKFEVYDKLSANEKLMLDKNLKFTRDSIRTDFFKKFKNDSLAVKFYLADSIETQYAILSGIHGMAYDLPKHEIQPFIKQYWSPYMTEFDDPVILSGWRYYFTWYMYANDLYKLAVSSGDTTLFTSANEEVRVADFFLRLAKHSPLIEKIYVAFYLRSLTAKYKIVDEDDFPLLDRDFEKLCKKISSKSIIEEFKKQVEANKALAILSKKGGAAPDFTLLDSSNNVYHLSDFTDKLLVLDLWATWCGPCIREFPYMKKLQQEFSGRTDITFVTVSTDYNRITWIEKGLRKLSPPGLALWAGRRKQLF